MEWWIVRNAASRSGSRFFIMPRGMHAQIPSTVAEMFWFILALSSKMYKASAFGIIQASSDRRALSASMTASLVAACTFPSLAVAHLHTTRYPFLYVSSTE